MVRFFYIFFFHLNRKKYTDGFNNGINSRKKKILCSKSRKFSREGENFQYNLWGITWPRVRPKQECLFITHLRYLFYSFWFLLKEINLNIINLLSKEKYLLYVKLNILCFTYSLHWFLVAAWFLLNLKNN